MKSALQSLTSERLRMRLLGSDDALPFFRHVTSDPETVRYVQWPVHTSLQEAEALVATFVAAIESDEKFYFAVEDLEGSIVAFASLKIVESTASIGFAVVSHRRRNGYAKEIIALLTHAAFRCSAVDQVEGLCDVDNLGSARALASAGFREVARLQKHAVHPNLSSEPRDLRRFVATKQPNKAPEPTPGSVTLRASSR